MKVCCFRGSMLKEGFGMFCSMLLLKRIGCEKHGRWIGDEIYIRAKTILAPFKNLESWFDKKYNMDIPENKKYIQGQA